MRRRKGEKKVNSNFHANFLLVLLQTDSRRFQVSDCCTASNSFLPPSPSPYYYNHCSRNEAGAIVGLLSLRCMCAFPNQQRWHAKMEAQSEYVSPLHTWFCTFGADLCAQSVLIIKISVSELSRKLTKSALLVGPADISISRHGRTEEKKKKMPPWLCVQHPYKYTILIRVPSISLSLSSFPAIAI